MKRSLVQIPVLLCRNEGDGINALGMTLFIGIMMQRKSSMTTVLKYLFA